MAVAQNTTAIAAISMAFIVGGYLVCFGLWWFVFRRSGAEPELAQREDEGIISTERETERRSQPT